MDESKQTGHVTSEKTFTYTKQDNVNINSKPTKSIDPHEHR